MGRYGIYLMKSLDIVDRVDIAKTLQNLYPRCEYLCVPSLELLIV
jgi:hypothetical protein